MVYEETYEEQVEIMFLVLWIPKIQRLQLSECSPEVIFFYRLVGLHGKRGLETSK